MRCAIVHGTALLRPGEGAWLRGPRTHNCWLKQSSQDYRLQKVWEEIGNLVRHIVVFHVLLLLRVGDDELVANW
jgi:hypothetical protein